MLLLRKIRNGNRSAGYLYISILSIMSRMKKIGIGLLLVLIVIQFIRPGKNQSANAGESFEKQFAVSEEVKGILKTSCYDCHSNNTVYPWYSQVQPVGWWLQHHVDEGKAELNFDEFASYAPRRQFHKLEEIEEMLNEKEMPLSSYLIIHGDAELSATQTTALIDWTNAMRDTMKAHYPADSLKMKKR